MTSPTCEALRDDIVALLYDDGEASERSRAREHLAACVPCRSDYAELKGVRKALGGWNLPKPVALPKARPALRWFPTSLAAVAGLILGIGVALAGHNALFLPAAPSGLNTATGSASLVSRDELQEALRSQESRHQAELGELRRSLIQVSEPAPSPSQRGLAQNASNLSPVTIETLLKASEERQNRLIDARLAGLRTESDLQRQYDMAQIAAGLAYIDSRTGADAARTSELMKNLVRVTAKPQDR